MRSLLCLLAVVYIFSVVLGANIYIVCPGVNNGYGIIELNNQTGDYTIIAEEKTPSEAIYSDVSCFDQKTQTMYFIGGSNIYSIDIAKKKVSTIPTGYNSVYFMTWDPVTSQLLIVAIPWTDKSAYLYAQPIDANTPAKPLLNLTALGVDVPSRCDFDPVTRMLYSTTGLSNRTDWYAGFIVQSLNIETSKVANTTFHDTVKCANYLKHIAYDTVDNVLVGVAVQNANPLTAAQGSSLYTVTIADGECTPSPVYLVNMTHSAWGFTSAAYDSQTSTYYISYALENNFPFVIFNTKTHKTTSLDTEVLAWQTQLSF